MTDIERDLGSLRQLYTEHFGLAPVSAEPLAGGGSPRRYYLLAAPGGRLAVGTCGDDLRENEAFVYLARHFSDSGLPVPEIFCALPDFSAYLQSYIPGNSLLDCILNSTDPAPLVEAAMRLLAGFHYQGSRGLNFARCYPDEAFDATAVAWDLNYFKYSFLKVAGARFDERRLQHDFDILVHRLTKGSEGWRTFMYRDFQSRNIIVNPQGIFYGIDFQGGRRGPAAYDVVSFLWQAKAGLSLETRQRGIESYCRAAAKVNPAFDRGAFLQSLPFFVLFRVMQTLGAYGFRGLIERKPHFLESLPLGIKNLKHLFDEEFPELATEFPELAEIARALPTWQHLLTQDSTDGRLTVTVQSFSYRKGYPVDNSGNGGGFVFDCRAVHNPGRYDRYKPLTGMDQPVKDFLEENGEIFPFLENAYSLVDCAVEKYISRGFTSLCVSFGCTGGRHRSVYSAHAMAEHLRSKYKQINVREIHREQPGLSTDNMKH